MDEIIEYWFRAEAGKLLASLAAQRVKNPPTMQETWVPSWAWKIPWKRERLPTPGFWPGEFRGLYSPWGHKESDTTVQLSLSDKLQRMGQPSGMLVFVNKISLSTHRLIHLSVVCGAFNTTSAELSSCSRHYISCKA